MLSVNQMNAQIKITEAWKASQDRAYPLKIEKVKKAEDFSTTRAITNGNVIVTGKTELVQSTYLSDTSNAWNKTPTMIKVCKTLWSAKKAIKKFVIYIFFVLLKIDIAIKAKDKVLICSI